MSRSSAAGVDNVHAHRWRHTYTHQWKLAGGLLLVMGWAFDDMPRHYGAAAAADRAQQIQARLRIGDHV